MAKLLDRLTFEIEYPAGTWNAILPTIEDVVLSKKREKGQFFYRLELETELLLRQGSWDFISAIEDLEHCADLNLRVLCSGETLFTGQVKLNNGNFDYSLCLANIKATTQDDYQCVSNALKEEVNIISDTPEQTLNFAIGEFETLRCPPSGTAFVPVLLPSSTPVQDSCLTEPDGWVVLENHFTNISPSGPGAFPPFTADQYTVWIRQRVDSATPPPGLNWVNIGGTTWVREPFVLFDEANSTGQPPPESEWHLYYYLVWGETLPIDNGVLIKDAIELMLDRGDCPLTVVSDFLGINPDGTAPTNAAYTSALAKMQNLLLFQISDVKRATASNNASIGIATLEEIFKFLALFKVYPSILEGNLRLEHISYYESKPISLDLTAPQFARWLRRKKKYQYDNSDSPRWEKFKWGTNTNNPFFNGYPIDYGAACSSDDSDTVQYDSGRFVTDVQSVIDFPELFSDDGFVVVNAIEFDSGLYIDTEYSVLPPSLIEVLNGHLSFPNLHDKYWRNYAYQATGKMNSADITFDSVRPSKKGEPITINKWCCTDFINFDPATLVTTELGNGEIEKITFSVRSGTVTFELSYGGGEIIS